MARSFEIVEYKVAESEFFLNKLFEASNGLQLFEARNYMSAFLAASRSITFAIQASISDIEDFSNWYSKWQGILKKSSLATYFLEARNSSQKVGYYPIAGGIQYRDSDGNLRYSYTFDQSKIKSNIEIPKGDVGETCKAYFIILLELVLDCYQNFGLTIDPEQYFSFEKIKSSGKTIEDFEEELGYPRGWTNIPRATEDDRLKAIRSEITYHGIDHILIKYLGKNRFGEEVSE